MIRLGLCCLFRDQSIKFSNTTVAAAARLERSAALEKLGRLCLANAIALHQSLYFCAENGIASFRIVSQILPLKSHPEQGYEIEELPLADSIVERFRLCGEFARNCGIRLSFHPDQFVVLNSPRPDVVAASIRELEYQTEVAEWVGADVVNVHGGGAYGDKTQALETFARTVARLSPRVRKVLTVENDDKVFTPADLAPVCAREGIPLVYDVHHHRCLPDTMTVEEATEIASSTWDREPMMHISSPLEGWQGPKPERHHDFIDERDFPAAWVNQVMTVEVEAKAKEVAVIQLMKQLQPIAPLRRSVLPDA